ncbi:methyltransferase domain-containing protein [Gangjinia marincola]|uniref:Methyltransferase domain-containing protein n=1 Tax=Gangjinia marincola TaxID=578463 RepID=A0ABN1MGE4_9FLAO
MKIDTTYWNNRYLANQTGWDIGYPSTPLKEYIDQIKDKSIRILIPGAGNAYEAEYLHQQGFTNVIVVDIASEAVKNFKQRVPNFPEEHVYQTDFFDLDTSFDLILEQTFFCALDPSFREAYAKKMHDLLDSKGKLVGVLFNFPLSSQGPPFGGSQTEYQSYFTLYFNMLTLEACHNSIPPRKGKEIFMILEKKVS